MKKFGIIGYPLEQSFSKQYYNSKFQSEGLDCYYDTFPIHSIQELSEILKRHSLEGFNVTIPYKKQVLQYLHDQSDEVSKTGACNCVKVVNGVLKGYNTDIIGFKNSFQPLLQSHHQKALILGTGGASAAVEYVLQQMEMPYQLVSRTKSSSAIEYKEIGQSVLDSYTIIINCTPVGMIPNVDEKPNLPYEFINPTHLLYDLIYKPAETLFLKEGKIRGAVIKNGYEMLLLQAEENWKIWSE